METLTLKLSPRTIEGKKVRTLRRRGIVPVHFYGQGTGSLALQVEAGVLQSLISRAGMSIPVAVVLDEQDSENICFIREVQRHPVTEDLLHVDFMRVDVSRKVTVDVPINLVGKAPGAEDLGGILLQTMQSLSVESLPMSIPMSFDLDITGLDDFEKTLRVSDLLVAADVTVIADPDAMVVRVQPPRVEEVEAVAEGVEEGLELEEGEEGEGAPEDAADQEGA